MADNSNRPPEDLTLDDLTEEEMEMVKNWNLPNVTDDKPTRNKTTALGRSVDWYYSKKEREEAAAQEQEEEIQPLSLEEIEEIRKGAYEEGLLQGHQEGLVKGEQEGLEQGIQKGIEQGHQQGVETGLAEGRQIIEAQAIRWQALNEKLANPLYEVNEQVEKQLVELAVMLSQAVIGVEIQTNPQIILQAVKESVAALPYADSECEISLNPQDLALIQEQYSEQEIEDKGWHLKAEPDIEIGGCIVESRTSSIDRSIQARINQVFERFLTEGGIKE